MKTAMKIKLLEIKIFPCTKHHTTKVQMLWRETPRHTFMMCRDEWSFHSPALLSQGNQRFYTAFEFEAWWTSQLVSKCMDVVREIRSLSELNAGLPARSISHFHTEISGLYSEDYVDVIIIIYFFKKKGLYGSRRRKIHKASMLILFRTQNKILIRKDYVQPRRQRHYSFQKR